MVISIEMTTLCIIGAVCIYLLLSGKVKSGGTFTGYSLITTLPVILVIVIPVFIIDIFILLQCIGSGFKENVGAIPLFIFALEIMIISIFSLIKLNVFPVFSFSKEADLHKRLEVLDSGRRLLNYCIYGNLLYSVLFLTSFSYFISKNHSTLGQILMHPAKSIGYLLVAVFFMMFFPFMALPFYVYAMVGFIVVTSLIFLICIIFILSINGVIRILYGSKEVRKKWILYIVLMLFPITNLFCMFNLCKVANRELKTIA